MATCPNKNLDSWKNLVQTRGENIAYFLWDKYAGNVPANEFKSDNQVNFDLKSANLLTSPKAEQLFKSLQKNKVTGDTFWKKVQELGIPKEQIDILKSFDTYDREELITEMLANYSYAVEINTSKTKQKNIDDNYASQFGFTETGERPWDQEKESPTQYYSNLIVPGGTNYTENEIATPAISPSIKGHAAFATDKGIGWFRSDDKAIGGKYLPYEQSSADIEENIPPYTATIEEGVPTKTRRILEVQSDLFQKGRDRKDLTERNSFDGEQLIDDTPQGINPYRKESGDSKENQFLQLLNKDNNWVTFFTKSIIQDSAKKGYKKVLFPVGDTAAKIEGHETLEEFIKDKEDRVIKLKREKKGLIDSRNIQTDILGEREYNNQLESKDNEIKQLEKEIADAKAGKLQISSIANFYETTIHNILKKQGFNPKSITDEYGNGWYEVSITPTSLNNIFLSLKHPVERLIDGFKLQYVKLDSVRQGFSTKNNKQNRELVKRIKDWIKDKNDFAGITVLLNHYGFIEFRDTTTMKMFSTQEEALPEPSAETVRKLKEFLKRIGVDIETLSRNESIRLASAYGAKEGSLIGGIADLLQKTIWLTEGREVADLTEETMHFAVEIIEQTNPKLFTEMFNKIAQYSTYENLLNSGYADLYRTKDGKLDVRKLKKEAIGKVLAQYALKIESNEETTIEDSATRVQEAQGWLQKILDWFKSLFKKPGFDPFAVAASEVLDNTLEGTADVITSEENYLSLLEPDAKQTEIYQSIIAQDESVREEDGKFYVNDIEIKTVVEEYSKKRLPEDTRPDILKEKDREIAEKGKADIKDILNRYVDENGYFRDEPLEKTNVSMLSVVNQNHYKALEKAIVDILEKAPQNSRIIVDKNLYDPDEKFPTVAHIDMAIIYPEGTMSIYEWNFVNLSSKMKDIPYQLKEAANTRISAYKRILKKTADVKTFRNTRSIPIKVNYKLVNKKYVLQRTEIGNENSDKEYLLPIVPLEERTGLREIDTLLDRLTALYQETRETAAPAGRRDIKRNELNNISKAIRHLQLRKDFNSVKNYIDIVKKESEALIKEYSPLLQDYTNAQDFTNEQISNYANRILTLQDKFNSFRNLEDIIRSKILNSDDVKLLEDISKTIKDELYDLNELMSNFGDKYIAKRNNVEGLLVAEREWKGISSWYKGPSKGETKAIQAFFRLENPAFQKTAIEQEQEYERLKLIQDDYMKWAKAKGLSEKNMFDLILKKDKDGKYKQERIDTIQKKFFDEYWKANNSKNKKWIKENINIEAFQEWAAPIKENRLAQAKSIRYDADDEINEQKLNSELAKIEARYNLEDENSSGWLNPEMRYFAKEEWYTEEFKQLNDKQGINKPALALWNYMGERVDLGAEYGVIDPKIQRTFTPLVYKYNVAEKLVFGKTLLRTGIESLIDRVTINDTDLSYGYIDPATGEMKNKLPFRFIIKREDVSDDLLSTQIFENLLLYNNELIRYKNLRDIEDQVKLLQRIEFTKESIKTNRYGRIPGGKVEFNKNNDVNAKLLTDMINGIVYQQKYTTTAFEKALVTFGKGTENTVKKINKWAGSEIIPTTLGGKSISAIKLWEGIGNLFRAKVMGVNIMIPTVNLFGSRMQILTGTGQWFTNKEFEVASWRYASRKFSGETGKKYAALLDYMVPMIHNYDRDRMQSLSVNKTANASMSEILYYFQEQSDKLMQGPIALAMLDNTAIVDGKLVNARKYIRDQYRREYYATTDPQKRKEITEAQEKAIQTLLKEKGLLNLTSIKDDRLEIEGLKITSDEFAKLRSQIQNITKEASGAMTEDDRAKYTMTLLGRSFMTFKNWIPPLAEKRFGKLAYNTGLDEWQIGRVTAVTEIFTLNFPKLFKQLRDITVANEDGIKLMDELLQKRREQHFKETGQDLEITPEVYYDVMRHAIKGLLRDIMYLGILFSLYLVSANLPPDDEDKRSKGMWKFYVRMTDKLLDEVQFYYNPVSIQEIANGSVIPAFGVLADFSRIISSFGNEMVGIATGDEEMQEKASPLKYTMKAFPFTNQLNYYLATLSPDYARAMNIQLTTESRKR